MPFLEHKLIRAFERKMNYDAAYLHEIAEASPSAFWKIAWAMPLSSHHAHVAPVLWYLARLGAVQSEGCGTCLQLVVDQAKSAGIGSMTLRSALGDGAELTALEADATNFGRMIASGNPDASICRERLAIAVGKAGLIDLALGIATARLFPTLKRAMGRAKSCSVISVAAE